MTRPAETVMKAFGPGSGLYGFSLTRPCHGRPPSPPGTTGMRAHGLAGALLLIPLLLLTACTANQPAPNPGAEPGGQCVWACKRWEKRCNLDPRGEYDCRRQCADFGEICE